MSEGGGGEADGPCPLLTLDPVLRGVHLVLLWGLSAPLRSAGWNWLDHQTTSQSSLQSPPRGSWLTLALPGSVNNNNICPDNARSGAASDFTSN